MTGAAVQPSLAGAPFAFGDLQMRFESADREWLRLLDRRYGRFRNDGARARFVVRFEPTRGPLPEEVVTPLAVHLEATTTEPTSEGYRFHTETTSCEIDLRASTARLRGPTAMYPLDNLLRHLLPLLWEEGVIVHAAALKDSRGRGLLACGPSGAGKSTLAQLAGEHALSDELAQVRREKQGNVLVSLPFWQAKPGRAPLAAILLLRHARKHRLEPLAPAAALKELASQVLWPVWDETALARAFEHFVRIVETTPAFEIFFAPEESVKRLLEEVV